ncbi:MAG: SGNH/GDSL hydrolase family protein [Proteobacteria bacterium]|nr:SGNH/GDSL hydrolase family protein [Pseudomonadota bacterium]
MLFLVALELFLQILAAAVTDPRHLDNNLPPVDEDAYRVFAVGDSWVYGAESEPHEAFIEVFKRAVEAETGQTVQIYNFGQSATNSSQAFVKLHTHIDFVRPHLVVVLSGANNMLHDLDVARAAEIMGEDVRLSGIRWLAWSRTYRVYRQWKAVRDAEALANAEPITPDPVLELLYGTGGEDPSGGTGLPPAPADPLPGELLRWEWWDSFARRDWKQLLPWIQATEPKNESPEARGILRAWEALALAHLGRHAEAETAAREALELGGDDAAAFEALAVVAEREDRELHAIQHRIAAASSDRLANSWLQARARGLVLLELEAWEAAEAWLLAAHRQEPGNYEVLLGLSRLPSATRATVVGDILNDGPRSAGVTQPMWYRWHKTSSGMVDRMVASVGEPDADEAVLLQVFRGRAAVVQGDPVEAERWFRTALANPAGGAVDRSRAEAGLMSLANDPVTFEALVGTAPADVALTPSNAAAVVRFHAGQEDCDSAVRTGQGGLALGLAPSAFEAAAGSCLSREVGWSLVEQALGHGPVLDRAAMVLGRPPGSLAKFVQPPAVPFWEDFRERDFEAVIAASSGVWKGLALAHLDRRAEALAVLAEAEARSEDGAVIAYARMLLAKQRGAVIESMIQGSIAATSEGGDPWIRTVALGITLADALHWRDAQTQLLSALSAAPGYLEALEALSMVPQPLRYPAAEVALRYTPSGRVTADRWSAWYLLQGRDEEALRALQWPASFLPEGDEPAARRAIALGDVHGASEDPDAARAAYATGMALAEALDDRHLYCRAAARRLRALGEDASDAERAVVSVGCSANPDYPEEHPEAIDALGRLAALGGECSTVGTLAERSLVAGADPSDVSEWMGDCADEASVLQFIDDETGGAPPEARTWLRHRVQPGDGDELPAPGEAMTQDLLVRQLLAMQALAKNQGSEFVALTYPFPGAHHQRLRDRMIAEGPRAGLTILDLYAHFSSTYSDAAWQALRTPEDHVNAEGYEAMGIELFEHVRRGGRLPR